MICQRSGSPSVSLYAGIDEPKAAPPSLMDDIKWPPHVVKVFLDPFQLSRLTVAREALETAHSRRIPCIARAISEFRLSDDVRPNVGIADRITPRYPKAVAQHRGVGTLLDAHLRSNLRITDYRVVITKIDNIAIRIVAEEVSLGVIVQQPRALYMVGNGFVGDLRVFDPVDRTTVLAGPLAMATRRRTTMRHSGLPEESHVVGLKHPIAAVTVRIVNVYLFCSRCGLLRVDVTN